MSDDIKITIVPEGKRGAEPSDEGEKKQLIPAVPIGGDWVAHSWYIARTRFVSTPPTQSPEDVHAVETLDALGIPAWYATGYKRRRAKGKANGAKGRCMANYLMFPGYVFIAHDGDSRKFAKVLNVRHIDRILGWKTNGVYVPVRVPGAAMQALFGGEGERIRKVGIESEPLEIGESVVLNEGIYAGFTAPIAKLISADRIEVVLEIFGSHRPVEIEVDKLRRL